MQDWLCASVVTTALTESYSTPSLLQSRLRHDQCSSRSVCMELYAWGVSPGSPGMAPHTSQRTRRLPAILLAFALVTSPIAAFIVTFQSRPNDWRWCLRALATSPSQDSQPAGLRYMIYNNQAIFHLSSCNIPPFLRNIPPFVAMEGGI